jgi:hypothetical protein
MFKIYYFHKMKYIIFIFLLSTNSLLAQSQKYVIDLRIGELKYENDSISFTKPIIISVSTNNITPFFQLGERKILNSG